MAQFLKASLGKIPEGIHFKIHRKTALEFLGESEVQYLKKFLNQFLEKSLKKPLVEIMEKTVAKLLEEFLEISRENPDRFLEKSLVEFWKNPRCNP